TNPGAAEPKIEFNLPGGSKSIRLAVIEYQASKPTSSGPVSNSFEKTIFEDSADLNAFEAHARPYMSAKIDSLKGAVPSQGTIVTVDVPVKTASGIDAVIKLEFPWRDNGASKLDLKSWWIGKASFAKGSPFNP
ncbi:MAG TPA: hypothetical protein VK427_10905, partial [Kofleriaceae bacterium]|nr:hypothetical protein [Kofleriaceae bacterium]